MGSSHTTSAGPDWEDVLHALESIEQTHTVDVKLLLQRAGGAKAYGLEIVGIATRQSRTNAALMPSVSRKFRFPNESSTTLTGCMFKLLHELDLDCSTMWLQTFLPME